MPQADSAARGLALLRERVGQAADFVERVPTLLEPLLESPSRLPRMLVTTGIGTSAGHARHLAEVASRWARQPARFAATGSLSRGTPAGAEDDWLIVFSQGLSANARFALQEVERWGGVVLVSGLPCPGDGDFDALDSEKRDWLLALRERGVVQIDMGCGSEYGTLIRVIGARVGYAIAWSLLRTLAARRFESIPELDHIGLGLSAAQTAARLEAERVFPRTAENTRQNTTQGRTKVETPKATPLTSFFDGERALLIVAEGGSLELATHLSLKIAEGMLRPQPRCVDVLDFAHGPLQSLAQRPTSILYLGGCAQEEAEQRWVERFEKTLDPELHELRVLRTTQRLPFSVLEYEAIFDELILGFVAETGVDLVAWPGADREAPLYAVGPRPPPAGSGPGSRRASRATLLEEAVWPEVERDLAGGCRTAVIGLGSIEQHGPHLPLGTDRWIAEALAQRLAARLEGAATLPVIAVGCASEHMAFPGTLHAEPSTLEALLVDLLTSISAHGFERAFIFTAHGGNIAALDGMRARLVQRAAPLELAIESDLAAVAAMQAAAVDAEGLDPASAGPHAGEYETSLVAALRPDAIRRGALEPGRIVSNGEAESFFYPSLRDHAENGVLGDPTSPSAERGRRYLEAWLERLELAYRAAFAGRSEKNRMYTKGTQKA